MIKPDADIYTRFFTYNSSGVLTDDDGTPVGVLVKNGTDTAETVTVTKLATGSYKAEFTIPSDAATGDMFELQITVTMSTVVQKDIIWRDIVDTYANSDVVTELRNTSGFEKIVPKTMLIPTANSNVYMVIVVADSPDNSEVGVALVGGDNTILYEDAELTTPLSASVTFEDYYVMASLNAKIYLCYVKVDHTETARQYNYIFVYAKNSVEYYHTSETSLIDEDVVVKSISTDAITADAIKTDAVTEIQTGLATSLALSTTDGKIDSIKTQTDKLHFSGNDVLSTLDSEKVTVSNIDNDVITAAVIKTDAITEIQSGLATSLEIGTVGGKVDGVVSTLGVAGAGLTALGDTRLANLNATVSSRMATFSYTAPDNQGITDIKAVTDKINFNINDDVIATLDSEKVTVSAIDNDAITAASIKSDAVTEIQTGLATSLGVTAVEGKVDGIVSTLGISGAGLTAIGDTRLANLDAAITTRMASFTYTAPDNESISSIKAKTDQLAFSGGDVIATLNGEAVSATVSDKTGFALTSAYDAAKTAASQTSVNTIDGIVDAIKSKTDNLPADPASNTQVNTRMETFVYTAPDNQGITDIKAITDKINFNGADDVIATLDSEKVTVTAIDNDVITAAAIKTDAITEIQSGLSTSLEVTAVEGKVDGVVTTLGVAGAGLTALGDARLDNLDAEISSRMETFVYTDPDNTSIADIKAKTDQLTFASGDVVATLNGETVTASSVTDKTGYALTEAYDAAKTAATQTSVDTVDGIVDAIKLKTDTIPADPATNTQVNTRMATFSYTAPDNASITAIKAKTDNLSFTGTDVKATLDGETVTAATVSDKAGYALTAAYDAAKTAASQTSVNTVYVVVDAIKAKTDNLPADPASNTQVVTRLASSAYTAPDNSSITAIKAKTDQLAFSSGDVIATLNGETVTTSSVTDKTGYYLANDAISSATVAASAVSEIQSGLATSSALSTVDTVVDAIKAKTDNLPSDPASNTVVNTRLASSAYTAPDNASITAIKERTDNLPDDPATETSLSTLEDKIDTIQSSVEAGNSSTPTVEEIVAGVLAGVVDGDITLKDAQERLLACLINNSEVSRIESDTYFNHYNTAGTEVVIQQKVDVEGNREIIT